jgi:hypothetical protein
MHGKFYHMKLRLQVLDVFILVNRVFKYTWKLSSIRCEYVFIRILTYEYDYVHHVSLECLLSIDWFLHVCTQMCYIQSAIDFVMIMIISHRWLSQRKQTCFSCLSHVKNELIIGKAIRSCTHSSHNDRLQLYHSSKYP